MRKLLIGLGIFVVLVVVAAIIVPLVIPGEVYRDRIVAAVQDATGRQLRIDGTVKVAILPSVAIAASGVALSNAPGAAQKDMATLSKLEVGLKLLPLLTGGVEIDRFVLVDPVIHLEIAKDGTANWEFGPKTAAAQAAPPAGQAVPQSTQTQQAAAQQAAGLRELHLGEVKLVNGTVDYFDARTNQRYAADQIGVTVDLPNLDQKSAIEGGLNWRGKPVKLSVALDRPRVLFGSGPSLSNLNSAAKIRLNSEPLNFSFDGTLASGAVMKAAGNLVLDVPSVRNLAAWAGTPVTIGGAGLGPLSIKGKLDAAGPAIAAHEIVLSLDSIKASGELSVDSGGAKPDIKGKLDVGVLDLNPYLAEPRKAVATAPAAPGPAAAVPPNPPAVAATGPNEWSDAPIDFSALNDFTADMALAATGIRYEKLEIGKSAVAVKLVGGKLTADLGELALYGGGGKGRVGIDGSGPAPTLSFAFQLNNVQVEPLLKAAIDLDRVSGTGQLDFDLTSHGRSQRELMGALAGKGALAFTKGAIKGIDLTAMAKNVSQAFLEAVNGASQQTEFSELTGTFTVANGIVRNDDLVLKSPAAQMGGAGVIDLPRRSMDYRVEPKVAVAGQDLAVPIMIQGPWSKLTYQPDVKSLVGKNAGKLLQGLTGSGSGKSTKPADILKGLLGK